MSDYGFTITDKGRFLIAKLATGVKLNLTRVMVGSGRPVDCAAREMTDLSKPIAEATSTVPTYVDDRVDMVVEYRSDLNGGLEQGFWLNEFGVYALDPDVGEILLYYGCLGDYPQWVSAASKNGVDVRRFPISIIIGYGGDVETVYSCGAWMTAEDVKKYCTDVMFPELLGRVNIEISNNPTPAIGVKTHYFEVKAISGYTPFNPESEETPGIEDGVLDTDDVGKVRGYVKDNSIHPMAILSE